MIHHLKGTLIEKSPSHAIMECAGIGYYLHISLTTYGQMADGDIRLFTHPVYREDAQLLYGFATTGERDVFLLLLSVSGVGANTARMILSALTPSETVQTIASGDSGSLQKIKGIGAKLPSESWWICVTKLPEPMCLKACLEARVGHCEWNLSRP